MPVIPALGRLMQEDHELEASLSYRARSCLKQSKANKQNRKRREGELEENKGVLLLLLFNNLAVEGAFLSKTPKL
jgi:hypothetical protein